MHATEEPWKASGSLDMNRNRTSFRSLAQTENSSGWLMTGMAAVAAWRSPGEGWSAPGTYQTTTDPEMRDDDPVGLVAMQVATGVRGATHGGQKVVVAEEP
jgi:hypothetical protein